MKTFLISIPIALLLISATFPLNSEARPRLGEYCVANGLRPDNVLQAAMDWACQQGGVDCSKIQPGQPCFLPNTIKDHASFVFNSYYKRYKQKGGYCYFKGAAIMSFLDPSHDACKFE